MNVGTVLLATSVATGALALIASLFPNASRSATLSRVAAQAHAITTAGALAWLALLFLVTDVRTEYVWDHTHASYPLFYKLAGVWGGQEGTVVLWGALVAVFAARVRAADGALDKRAAWFLTALSTTLGAIALSGGTFRETAAPSLANAIDGAGMADVLLTPLMVIHPPVQFAAYALIAVPAAYALAHWTRPDAAWTAAAYRWARPAWLFATLGLGLGALWAYYVLSFGGYWAWDPVENGNLLPWLALTAFLHAGKQTMRVGDMRRAAPLLALAAFVLTVFATFATRSGLWVSVHAFTDPTGGFEPDAAARLLGILAHHAPSRAFLGLFTSALFAGLALFLLHEARALPRAAALYARAHASALLTLAGVSAFDVSAVYALLFEAARLSGLGMTLGTSALATFIVGVPAALVYLADESPSPTRKLDLRRLMAAAALLLASATLVTFLLNMQIVNGQARELFDARAPLVALPIVSVLTVALALGPLGRNRALMLSGAGLLLGVAGLMLFPGARVVALVVPPLVAAGLAAVLKLVHVMGTQAPPRLRLAGALLLSSSLLGFVFWSNPPTRWFGLDLSAWTVPLGVAGVCASTLGILGAIASFRAREASLVTKGAIAATLAAGYGIGAPLAIAALVLSRRERGGFQTSGTLLGSEGARLREAGVYLVHFALVLGLLGYAASTYSQESGTLASVAPGTTQALGAYEVTLLTPTSQAVDGHVQRVSQPVTLTKDGRVVAEGALALEWEAYPASTYRTRLDVQRGLLRDVYLQPMAFHTQEAGWVSDGETNALPTANVDAVTFRVVVLPLMTPVWACVWLMVVGMGFVLAGTRTADDTRSRRTPVAAGSDARAPEAPEQA